MDRYYNGDDIKRNSNTGNNNISYGNGYPRPAYPSPSPSGPSLLVSDTTSVIKHRLVFADPKNVYICSRHFNKFLELCDSITNTNTNGNTNSSFAYVSASTVTKYNASSGSTPNKNHGSETSSAVTRPASLPAGQSLSATVPRQVSVETVALAQVEAVCGSLIVVSCSTSCKPCCLACRTDDMREGYNTTGQKVNAVMT